MARKKLARGFTLIEMVIYIALLTLIMGSVLAATFELLQGQSKAGGHNATEEEGSFVLSKFAWAMGQVTAIGTPLGGTTHTLDLTTASGQVQMCFANSAVRVRVGPGACDAAATALTTGNVSVGGLDFIYLPAVGSGPAGIEASTTIGGQAFRMTRYLRK